MTPSGSRSARLAPGPTWAAISSSYVQVDGDRPDRAIGQPHPVTDGFVVFLAEKPPKGREATIGQQFEVAELAREKVP